MTLFQSEKYAEAQMKFLDQTTLFSTVALLLLMLVPFASARSQESAQLSTEEFTKQSSSPVLASRFEFEHEPETNPFDGVSQQPAQTPTPQANSYVFPSSERRLKRYGKSMVGPFALLRVAASSGLDQWDDNPLEWGQGAEGYGKRFASNFGKNVIRQTVSYALSEALKLDTGFERSTRKGFWPRLSDALVQNVTSRTRSGKRVISAPIFAGAYASAIIPAETWYPERYSWKDGLRSGTYSFATGFGINIFREFVYNW
jgi:hypothetical protein